MDPHQLAGIKIEGFFSNLRECGGQKILECSDKFEQNIYLYGFQFDPDTKYDRQKKMFYILFESEQKRNMFFHQSDWLREVKQASRPNRIVIKKVLVDLSNILILQYNELNFYPSTYEKITWKASVIEEFSNANTSIGLWDFVLSRPRMCDRTYSWEICMEHISVMELLAKIAEANSADPVSQKFLFNLSITHTEKCQSNISLFAQVATYMNFPGADKWRDETERKHHVGSMIKMIGTGVLLLLTIFLKWHKTFLKLKKLAMPKKC